MTQFKETEAFEDLQSRVCHEITGVFLARLQEVGVPDDKLEQVSEDICYDLVAAMCEIGKYQVPGAEIYADVLKAKLKEMAALEAKVKEFSGLEEKLEEISVLEARVSEMAVLEANLEAKVKGMVELEEKLKEMAALEEKVNEIAVLESNLEAKVKEMTMLEAKLKKMTHHQSRVNQMAALGDPVNEIDVLASRGDSTAAQEVWTDASEILWDEKVVLKKAEVEDQPFHPEESILSPEKALSILNTAR